MWENTNSLLPKKSLATICRSKPLGEAPMVLCVTIQPLGLIVGTAS